MNSTRLDVFPYDVTNDNPMVKNAVSVILAMAAQRGNGLRAQYVTIDAPSPAAHYIYDAVIFTTSDKKFPNPLGGNDFNLITSPTDYICASGYLAYFMFVTIGDLKIQGLL